VGKIWDIFAGRGLTRHLEAGPNAEAMEKTLEGLLDPGFRRGLLFVNLVDFDMLYNHRQDPEGLIKAMVVFDQFLPKLFDALKEDDALFISADHGNDPTDQSTDHTREYVPLLCFGRSLSGGKNLGTRKTFADLGQSIAEILGIPPLSVGTSFADEVLR
jgi:phosphopentomutase